jgi:hypothetical protein
LLLSFNDDGYFSFRYYWNGNHHHKQCFS